MTTVQRDNSDGGDISRSVTWQFDNAEKLCAFIDSLGNFYRASTKDFHDGIADSLADIERADDFGLSVWGKLLNCKRPILADDEDDDFTGGVLSTELYRRVLAARLRLLNSNGSIDAFCNAILDEFDNHVSVTNNGDMSITFEVKSSATDEEAQLIAQFPDIAFIYPAGIRDNTPATAFVFGLSGQETDTTYTIGGLDESSFFWK